MCEEESIVVDAARACLLGITITAQDLGDNFSEAG
jgi:hypothetical protein